MQEGRLKTAAYIFIIASIVFSLFTLVRILISFHLLDLAIYYQSGKDILAGRNPYTDPQIDFNYPPTALLLFSLLALIRYEIVEKVWTVVSFLSLIGSVYVLLRSQEKTVSLFTLLFLFSLAIQAFPVKFTLGMGQINLVILFLLTLAFFLYCLRQRYTSGILLGIAAAIKLFPILLLLFFIRKRQWATVISALITWSLAVAVSIAIFGSDLTREYFLNKLPSIPSASNAVYYNQALTGLLAREGIRSDIGIVINFAVFGAFLLMSFLATRPKSRKAALEIGEYGLFIISILIGSGFSWQHHFVLLLIPFTAVFLYLRQSPRRPVVFIFLSLLSYILISTNIKHPEQFTGISTLLLSHVLYGAFILWLVVWLLLVGRNKSAFL